jgi:UDP-N-acetyl-D-glucosamine dehydrogenase
VATKSVGVLGLGYVGLPLAVALGRHQFDVVGFDVSQEVTKSLTQGRSHVQDISDAELSDAIAGGLTFTNDTGPLSGLDTYVICVPTPLGSNGHPDLDAVSAAGATVGAGLKHGSLVILESTTYPGTTEELLLPILEQGSSLHAGTDFLLAYSPERIDPGNPKFNLQNTPKIVGGINGESTERAAMLYQSIGVPVVRAKGLREAELAKLLENTYRHVNIALVNEMVKFCNALGIDLNDAIDCAATKPFGFEPFYPGPGVGGHCIPIDPNYLSFRVRAQLGYPFRFVELAQEINASMPSYVVHRIQEALNEQGKPVKDSQISLLGITYKKDVADRRESPADPIARQLLDLGARLSYADPFVEEWRVNGQSVPRVGQESLGRLESDCLVVLQDHTDFLNWDFEKQTLVLDTRGKLRGDNVQYL